MTLLPFFAIIFLLPFIVLLTYILFRVFKSCCCYACKTQNASQNNETTTSLERQPLLAPTTSEVTLDNDYVQDDLYADRICNPGGYNKYNQYQPLSELQIQ